MICDQHHAVSVGKVMVPSQPLGLTRTREDRLKSTLNKSKISPVSGERIMLLQFRSCRKCLGDLILDGDDWRCWQCGRYYYPSPPITEPPPVPEQPEQPNGKATITPRRQRLARSVNSLISSTSRSESRWWHKNQDVITFLDEGWTVKEIASLINRSQRQIRVIRERLNDLRHCGAELQPTG